MQDVNNKVFNSQPVILEMEKTNFGNIRTYGITRKTVVTHSTESIVLKQTQEI